MTETKALRLAPIIGDIENLGRVSQVKLLPMAPDDRTSPKGSRTWNYIYQADAKAGEGRHMMALRVRGEQVGNHFHPRVTNKDPERFLLRDGWIEFWFEDLFGHKRVEPIHLDIRKNPPMVLIIPPYILHGIRVMGDVAIYDEIQTGPFNPEHNYDDKEFQHLREHLVETGKIALERR